jgi:ABC-type transport system involved in multi-copper enzyme maturation permease subunit
MFAIYKRELKTYFQNPIGYIYMSIFLLLSGIFFYRWKSFQYEPAIRVIPFKHNFRVSAYYSCPHDALDDRRKTQ